MIESFSSAVYGRSGNDAMKMRIGHSACGLIAALLAVSTVSISAGQSSADPVADFYRRKTVSVFIGFGPGGGYDLSARVLARHMARHIPGQPTLVPRNMPAAGSLQLANYLYNV